MSDPIRVGIIGAVKRGGSFVRALRAHPQAELVALCDIQEEKLREAADDLHLSLTFTSDETMLDSGEIDAVVVATPMPLHVPQSVMALEQGIHVLSEVPAGVSYEQCRELVRAAKRSSATYMMAENYTYMRPNVIVKEIARRGLFGEMYFGEGAYIHELKGLNEITTWRRRWQTGVNGNTYITHSLGPVLQWMDQRVTAVLCAGSGHHYTDPRGDRYELEDTVETLCRLSGGGLARIRLDMLSDRPHNMTWYALQGTDGAYEAGRNRDEPGQIWLRSRSEEPAWEPIEDLAEQFLPEKWLNPPEEALQAGHGGGDYWEIHDFVDAIVSGSAPPIGIHEALDMTLAGLASQQSIAERGQWVAVEDSRTW
ncbi:MAG: Gfo/Idh/MocA family oxidoreductase [candidate division WS1 bacterium]|jgi:predicted dehydrogenase|nr:Gfo/Idh/MocA family oxidoreductase [candidate division WS1 bacterium]